VLSLWRIIFDDLFNGRIAFAWKLGLVACSVLPLQILCGFFRFRLQRTLSDDLRKAYAESAEMACEQVAAIRTVASLNREEHVLREFVESLEKPVHDALIKTIKTSGVVYLHGTIDNSGMRSV
jgi:ATP-binding cassette, subfamily B (MDR/TAP), member 1